MTTPASAVLHQPLTLEFDYTRSLGPVLSQYISGLGAKQVIGGVLSDGRVAVPPPDFDPATHDAVTEMKPVASEGSVVTWSWVAEPLADQPLDHPFAFALVLLDGADTPFLHAVDAGSPEAMSSGMRVRARWADEPTGSVRDLACFEPADASTSPDQEVGEPGETKIGITSVRLSYDYAASPEESVFGKALKEGRILGQRCPVCQKMYVPPRGACPVDGVPTSDPVEMPDTGIVTTFCIVNVPFLGQRIKPPYVSAYVLLDGADIAFLHLILGVDAHDVRMGMRVRAVWKPEAERSFSMENISHFEPTGEPDADYETYRRHL
ncbi:MAG: OB-fold domain-containing protein [Nocardioidaceae bacterium]|nr:OB-fold domain-containing protein [Nocardioidaceae bacterium]